MIAYLGDQRIGVLEEIRGDRFAFVYDDDWRFRTASTPLSLSMPLSKASHEHAVVEAFIDNLLPDSNDVRERWGREFQVSARNPFALLRHVGSDLPGAVRFLHEDEQPEKDSEITWLDDDDVAERLAALAADPTAWFPALDDGRFSLAGVQRKIALFNDGQRWGKPNGSVPTTHILKPSVDHLMDHDLNEHVCMAAASKLGLITARSRIASFGSERVIVVERFDRWKWRDKEWIRVHQEDLCQSLAVLPRNKYQNEGGPSPKQIADLFRRVQPEREAAESARRFVDALIFNWLIVGSDAHAKNYSVLLQASQVRLAPLYDLASLLPYDMVYEAKQKLAMKIGGEYNATRISGRHWRRLAEELALDEVHVIDRTKELCETITDAFRSVCNDPAVTTLGSDMPNRLLVAVENRARRCRAKLTH